MSWAVLEAKSGEKVARLDKDFGLIHGTPNAKKLFASRPVKLPYLSYVQADPTMALDDSFGLKIDNVDTGHINYAEALAAWLADYGLILNQSS